MRGALQRTVVPVKPTVAGLDLRGEQGVVLPLVAGCIVALVLIFGLAVDGGNLYRARLRAQKAADGAAFAAASVMAIERLQAKAFAAGERVGRANLEYLGMHPETADISVSFDSGQQRMQADIEVEFDLLLLDAVPGMGQTRTVTASAIVEISPTIVSVIAENSGGMWCPMNTPDCDCYPTCGNRKISRAKPAIQAFVDFFDPTRDYVSITRFANGAETAPNMPGVGRPNGGFDATAIRAAITTMGTLSLPAQSNSNICDAFMQAYLDTRDVVNTFPLGTETQFVVFTSGYATAGRFAFASPRPALPTNQGISVAGQGWATYDYTHWEMRLGNFYYPSPLIKSDVGMTMWYGIIPPHLTIPEPGACSSYGDANVSAPFAGCLNDWSFRTGPRTWKMGNTDWGDYGKRYYDCAIAWSDLSRETFGSWFTVGFGEPCPAPLGDPYQDVGGPGSPRHCRRDVFLRRVAFSRSGANDPQFPDLNTYGTLASAGALHGSSLEVDMTVDAVTEMRPLFERIARRNKLRLVQ